MIVPVRACVVSFGFWPVFASTVYVTVPLPIPEAPAVTVIQLAFDVADHVQVAPVVTVTLPVPPLLGSD